MRSAEKSIVCSRNGQYLSKDFPTFSEFSIVDKTTLCMEDCYRGVYALYPVTFSTAHFCLVHCMVHASMHFAHEQGGCALIFKMWSGSAPRVPPLERFSFSELEFLQ